MSWVFWGDHSPRSVVIIGCCERDVTTTKFPERTRLDDCRNVDVVPCLRRKG